MQSTRALAFSANIARSYAPKYPRPRPGTSERPPYRAPDPLINNPKAVVTKLEDDQLTFIHRPPPTAPTPFSLTTSPASPLLQTPSEQKATLLPPPLQRPSATPAPPRMSEEDLIKMRDLRQSDPFKYTRGRLAKMFNCTQAFVGQIAPLKKSARKATWRVLNEKHDRDRATWSEKHSLVKAIQAKRREMW